MTWLYPAAWTIFAAWRALRWFHRSQLNQHDLFGAIVAAYLCLAWGFTTMIAWLLWAVH